MYRYIFILFLAFMLYMCFLAADADFNNENALPRSHAKLMSGGSVIIKHNAKTANDSDLVVLPVSRTATAVKLHTDGKEVCVIMDEKNSSLAHKLMGRIRCSWNKIPYGRGTDLFRTFM